MVFGNKPVTILIIMFLFYCKNNNLCNCVFSCIKAEKEKNISEHKTVTFVKLFINCQFGV